GSDHAGWPSDGRLAGRFCGVRKGDSTRTGPRRLGPCQAERPEAGPAQNRGEKGWRSSGVAPCRHQQGRDRPPVADRPNLGSPYSGLTYFPEKYGPATTLRRLTERTHCIVVYKVDRLSRSLLDFTRIMEILDKHDATFVSVTQQFNTTTSLGRLTLNMLLSFAPFEREMIPEPPRDKMPAARRKGKWVGGNIVLGYDLTPKGGALLINKDEAERVREIFQLYLKLGSLIPVIEE